MQVCHLMYTDNIIDVKNCYMIMLRSAQNKKERDQSVVAATRVSWPPNMQIISSFLNSDQTH